MAKNQLSESEGSWNWGGAGFIDLTQTLKICIFHSNNYTGFKYVRLLRLQAVLE